MYYLQMRYQDYLSEIEKKEVNLSPKPIEDDQLLRDNLNIKDLNHQDRKPANFLNTTPS